MRPEELEQTTVKVLAKGLNVESSGTAFFLTPNLLLTCAHVVMDPLTKELFSPYVTLRRNTIEVKARVETRFPPEDFPDLALLVLDKSATEIFPEVIVAPLGLQARQGDKVSTYGYSDLRPNGDVGTYEIEGWVPYTADGPTWETLKVKQGQVVPGMSGGPLLNHRTGQVCGVIKRTRSQKMTFNDSEIKKIESNDLGGIIVSMSAFLKAYPEHERLFEGDVSPDAPSLVEREKLAALCAGQVLPNLHAVYDQSRPGSTYIPPEACPTLLSILRHLAEFSAPEGRPHEHPIYRFAVNLAASVVLPATAEKIRSWVRQALTRRKFPDTLPGETRITEATLYVEVNSGNRGQTYYGMAWMEFSDKDRTSPPFPTLEDISHDVLRERYITYLCQCLQISSASAAGAILSVDLSLPNCLLMEAYEIMEIRSERRSFLLGKRWPLTLRAAQRDSQLDDLWATRWHAFAEASLKEKTDALLLIERMPNDVYTNADHFYECLLASNYSALTFPFLDIPEDERENYLNAALDAGLPILIWGRASLPNRELMHQGIKKLFSRQNQLDLPWEFYTQRQDGSSTYLNTALLWDDFQQPEVRASRKFAGMR